MCHIRLIKVGFLEIMLCESFQRRGKRGRIHKRNIPRQEEKMIENAYNVKVLNITIYNNHYQTLRI